jgi:hypothetical protein
MWAHEHGSLNNDIQGLAARRLYQIEQINNEPEQIDFFNDGSLGEEGEVHAGKCCHCKDQAVNQHVANRGTALRASGLHRGFDNLFVFNFGHGLALSYSRPQAAPER